MLAGAGEVALRALLLPEKNKRIGRARDVAAALVLLGILLTRNRSRGTLLIVVSREVFVRAIEEEEMEVEVVAIAKIGERVSNKSTWTSASSTKD